MKPVQLCLAAAMAMAIPATASAQDTTQGPDEPMRMIIQMPAAVAFMTTPRQTGGDLKQAWTWLFLKQAIPNGANVLALEWEINCTAGTVRTARTAAYQDAAWMMTEAGPATAAAPTAGTPGAVTMNAVCSQQRSRVRPVANLAAARASAAEYFATQP